MTVKTSHFGTIELDDGDVLLADGGIHGVSGHRLHVGRDGTAHWSRHVDSFRPSGEPGQGSLALSSDELQALRGWADDAWQLSMRRDDSPIPPEPGPPPRWVWIVAVRRGDTTRLVQGSGISFRDAPDQLEEPLMWLRDRVDTLAGA